jgi:hypothetical protein
VRSSHARLGSPSGRADLALLVAEYGEERCRVVYGLAKAGPTPAAAEQSGGVREEL